MFSLIRTEKRSLGWLLLGVLASVAGAGVQVGFAWALRGLTQEVEAPVMERLAGWLTGIAVLFVLMGLVSAAGRYVSGRYASLVMRNVRVRTAEKLLRVRVSELEKRRTGDIQALMGNDMNQLSQYFEDHLPGIAYNGAWFLLAFVSAIFMSWELLLLSFSVAPVIMLLVSRLGKPVQQWTQAQNDALGHAGVIAQDAVSGQVEVKAFGLQAWLAGRHGQAVGKWVDSGERAVRARVGMDMANFTNVLLPLLAMGGFGALFVIRGRMSMADGVGCISLCNGLMNPLVMLGQLMAETRRANGAAGRLKELLAMPEEREDGDSLEIDPDCPLVDIRNLDFSYEREEADGKMSVRMCSGSSPLPLRPGSGWPSSVAAAAEKARCSSSLRGCANRTRGKSGLAGIPWRHGRWMPCASIWRGCSRRPACSREHSRRTSKSATCPCRRRRVPNRSGRRPAWHVSMSSFKPCLRGMARKRENAARACPGDTPAHRHRQERASERVAAAARRTDLGAGHGDGAGRGPGVERLMEGRTTIVVAHSCPPCACGSDSGLDGGQVAEPVPIRSCWKKGKYGLGEGPDRWGGMCMKREIWRQSFAGSKNDPLLEKDHARFWAGLALASCQDLIMQLVFAFGMYRLFAAMADKSVPMLLGGSV